MSTVMLESMQPSFESPGDEMPCGTLGCRSKGIHCVGVVAKVKFVPNPDNHLYTGIFKGADHGIVRLSVAKPTVPILKESAPGMGLKFLRDGVDSANLVAMYSVDGQPSYNYFEHDWSNHIPDLTSKYLIPLAEKFTTATKYIQTIGLSDMATYSQNGQKETPRFPFKLRFEPTAGTDFPDDEYHYFTD